RVPEPQAERADVAAAGVVLQRGADHRVGAAGQLGRGSVVADALAGAPHHSGRWPEVDQDVDLVGGEELGGPGDGGAQHGVEVDDVELVGGLREALPRL